MSRLRPLRVLMVVLGLALVVMILWGRQRSFSPAETPYPTGLASYGEIAPFELTDTNGQTITKDDLKGKIWLANFIFTRCPSMCPAMSLQFRLIGKTLPPNVGLLSISVDPEHDTPDVLAAYAARYREGIAYWHFLTGPKAAVQGFIKSCHIGIDDDPNMHSLRFVLIDDKAQIRGYYDSSDAEAVRKIKKDIAQLL